MSANVGPSVETFVAAGPPSQPNTTRTTPDSGLGGDAPPGFPRPPMQMNATPAAAYQDPTGPGGDYTGTVRSGMVYYQPQMQMNPEAFNRMQMNRGQQHQGMHYQEIYGQNSAPSQSDYYSNQMMPPEVQMPQQPIYQQQPQQSQHWDNNMAYEQPPPQHAGSGPSRQQQHPGQGYDGGAEMAGQMMMSGGQQPQHYMYNAPPPGNLNMYPQYMMSHAQQQPMMIPPQMFMTGYPPQMVAGQQGMMPPHVMMAGQHMFNLPQRGPQHQYGTGIMQQPPFSIPPPNMAHPIQQGHFVPQQPQQHVGGFSQSGGYSSRKPNFSNRGVNCRDNNRGRNNVHRNGSSYPHSTDNRSESARSGSEAAPNVDVTEDLTSSMTEMKLNEAPEASSSPEQRQRAKQMLSLATKGSSPPPEETESAPAKTEEPPRAEAKGGEKAPVSSSEGCHYCRQLKKPESECVNHQLKENSKIVCPEALRTMKCDKCGQIGGPTAHFHFTCTYQSSENLREPRSLMEQNPQQHHDRMHQQQQRGGGGQGNFYSGTQQQRQNYQFRSDQNRGGHRGFGGRGGQRGSNYIPRHEGGRGDRRINAGPRSHYQQQQRDQQQQQH